MDFVKPKITRGEVECSVCGKSLTRTTWNYGKGRPVTQFFCDTTCKGIWQKEQRESLGFTREWLEEEYINKGRSANDIAREIGRDSKRVWEWIRDYGLPTRPRGNCYDQGYKQGGKGPMLGRNHSEKSKAIMSTKAKESGRLPYDPSVGPRNRGKFGPESNGWKGGLTPERQGFYYSDEWKESVKAVWSRDNATCQRCGKHHNTAKSRGTFHIHHIISFQHRETRSCVDNLVLLCRKCHLFVHSRKNINNDFIK